MYKKGFLLAEETLKIIIALICIVFLVYFLAALYFSNQADEKLEQAEASLNHLVKEINSLEEDETRTVEIYNPGGWFVTSWPQDEKFQKNCNSKKGCICISSANAQNTKAVCSDSEYKVNGNQIKIEKPPLNLKIDHGSKIISKLSK